jgi:glycosyltransferase involved in cell wall biosynthesis
MSEERRNSGSHVTVTKVVRPALIVSQRTVFEYSMFLEHILVGLADESIRPALICPPDCDVNSVISGAVEVIRYPIIKLPLAGPYNKNRLVEQLAKFEATILHCLCESKANLTKQLARRLGLPYVISVNSLLRRRPSWSRHCAKIIVPTKSIAANVAKTYPHAASRVEQINMGTFVEQSCVCFSNPSRLASMVTAHPLDSVADFENLFGAIRHLTISGYEFMLAVIGTGWAERQLRELLAAMDLAEIVTIVPGLQPWRSILAGSDIFIQPQPNTAFNPFMLEAMSVGSAVAACKGGVDDFVIEDKTAVVFDPNNEVGIRSSLQRLFDRREFARQLATGAQDYIRENHSVSKMISATLQVYHQAQK